MKRVYKERAEKFYELKQIGQTEEDIANSYFLTVSQVQRIIESYESQLLKSKTPRTVSRTKPSKSMLAGDQRAKEFRELRLKGVTLEDIGSTYGITRQRVDQLIKRYERRYNLPDSTPSSKQIAKQARYADKKEYGTQKKLDRQFQGKHVVETIQLDAGLVGSFLRDIGYRRLSYRYYGRTSKRKDGTPFPSNQNPTCVEFGTQENGTYTRYKLHHWVLHQYDIEIPEEMDVHHIDGDITNNMRENLQLLSGSDHMRITMREQWIKGILPKKSRSLTIQQVEEIRAFYRPRITPIQEIAKKYGVSIQVVHSAIHGLGAYSDINPVTAHPLIKPKTKQITFDDEFLTNL